MRLRQISGLAILVSALTPVGEMAVGAPTDTQTQQPAQPQYDPTAGTIINGLKGVATGAQATLDSYRDNARSKKIQDALELAIDKAIRQEPAAKPEDAKPADGAAKPKDNPKPTASVQLKLSDVALLCDVREEYARAKAYADDITAFTGAFDKVATPPAVTSLGSAITSLLTTYKLDLSSKGAAVSPDATRNACITDLKAWADDYYLKRVVVKGINGEFVSATITPPPTGLDNLFGDLSAISGVIGAIINIITPIIENVALTNGQVERQAVIDSKLADPEWEVAYVGLGRSDKNLGDNRKIEAILNEAETLLTKTNTLADRARHVALGQFMEKLEALQEVQIDLTALKSGKDECPEALNNRSGESENLGGDLATSAATPAGSTTLRYTTVPGWLDKDFNISGGPLNPNAIPASTTVKSVSDAIVTMSNPTKSAFLKGTTIWLVSATNKEDYIGLQTTEPAKIGDKTLHFKAPTVWPTWATSGAKIEEPSNEKIAANTKMTELATTVEMSNAATAAIPPSTKLQITFTTASKAYISCFAQASKKISSAANDTVNAAKAYDSAAQAQASTDDLKKQIGKIRDATHAPWPWKPDDKSPQAEAAAELTAFGAAMQSAFSGSNITALQNALDAIRKNL